MGRKVMPSHVPISVDSCINNFVSNEEIPLSKNKITDEVSNNDLSSRNWNDSSNPDLAKGLDYSSPHYDLKRTREFIRHYRRLQKDSDFWLWKSPLGRMVIKNWLDKEIELLVEIGNHKPSRHPYSYEEYCYFTDQRLKNKYNKRNYDKGIFGEENYD